MYGNITHKTSKTGNLEFKYTIDGLLETALSNGMLYRYTYDVMGRILSKQSSGRNLISYEYDKNGNIIKQTDITGKLTEYSYNSIDKVVKTWYNGVDIAEYEYYDNGLKKSIQSGTLFKQFEYDIDQNLTSLNVKNAEQTLVNNQYSYDKNGNRTQKQTINGLTNYQYDNIGQVKQVDYPNYSENLFYDKRGNRTKRIKNGAEELYNYDPRNRLTELSKNGNTTHFEYDNAGNLLKDDKSKYTYNDFNQTTKVETFDGNVQINRYDAEGLRHEMEENGQLVQFIFNQNREVIAEKENTWTSYIRTSELIASSTEHARTYYHYTSDEMGSITHITEGENTLNEYEYDAWGEVVSQKETVKNRFKFNGQQLGQCQVFCVSYFSRKIYLSNLAILFEKSSLIKS